MSLNTQEKGFMRRTFRMVSAGVIWTGLSLMYYFLWMGWYAFTNPRPFFGRGNLVVLAIYAVLLFLFTRTYGGYRLGDLRIFELIYSHALSLTIVNGISWLQVSLLAYKLVSPVPFLLLSAAQVFTVTIWAVVGNRLFYTWFPPRNMLLIYGTDALDVQLLHKLQQRPEKYKIKEILGIEKGLDTLLERAQHYSAIILCDVESPQRNDLLKFCYEHAIRVYMTPKLSDIIIRGSEEIQLFDTPLLVSKNRGPSLEQQFVKRTVDILLSAAAIVLGSPVFLLVAAAIKLEDGGPVLFRQDRCTKGGKVFRICKFRSMIVDAEKEGHSIPAVNNDPRITKVGRVIRATRLDELPQFFNIFMGSMSIVGPRPERIEHVEKYSRDIPEFGFRHMVKGGLTGYAQVVGRYNTTPYDKLKLDLMYIQNYSLLLDLKIILMTIKIMFMRESTQGFGQEMPQAVPEDGTETMAK